MNRLESKNLLSECQHGFRNGRSCITQLLQVMEDFTSFIDDKNCIDVLYLDFCKAFDSVPHVRLFSKLEVHAISKNILNWIVN